MKHWTKDWTIEIVENNYKAIGCIDPEDVVQLIADAKELQYLRTWLGDRHINELLEMAGENEDQEMLDTNASDH